MGGMLKLYQEVDQYEVVLGWIEEHQDEIAAAGGVLPKELEDLLDMVEGSLQEKVERTGLVIKNLQANAKVAAEEAKRLSEIAKTYERQAESLKSYLSAQLIRGGVKKLDSPRLKAWFQKNGRPSVRPANPDVIPERYKVVTYSFDAQKAYEDLKEQDLIPEPEDGAVEIDGVVIERGQHLRLK